MQYLLEAGRNMKDSWLTEAKSEIDPEREDGS